jgi:hypothetical protein
VGRTIPLVKEVLVGSERRFLWGLFERTDLVVFTVIFVATGLAVGVWVLPGEWSLPMRLGAGLALGLAAVLSLLAPRMIGGQDFD